MVRLRCPSCEVIVKLDDRVAQAHETVRCAACKGVIPVQQNSLAEKPSPRARKPKRRSARQRQNSIVPIVAGLLAAVTIIVVIVVVAMSSKNDSTQVAGTTATQVNQQQEATPTLPGVAQATKQQEPSKLTYTQLALREEALQDQILAVLESVKTADDAKGAIPKLKKLRQDEEANHQQLKKAADAMTKEEWTENLPRFAGKAKRDEQYDQRYFVAIGRIRSTPQLAPYSDQLTSKE